MFKLEICSDNLFILPKNKTKLVKLSQIDIELAFYCISGRKWTTGLLVKVIFKS